MPTLLVYPSQAELVLQLGTLDSPLSVFCICIIAHQIKKCYVQNAQLQAKKHASCIQKRDKTLKNIHYAHNYNYIVAEMKIICKIDFHFIISKMNE